MLLLYRYELFVVPAKLDAEYLASKTEIQLFSLNHACLLLCVFRQRLTVFCSITQARKVRITNRWFDDIMQLLGNANSEHQL
jgi:hypothetical protein